MIKTFSVDHLTVHQYTDRTAMGKAASDAFATQLRRMLKIRDYVRTVFAAAPSQHEFLASLCQQKGIDWRRVIAFHMDEYIGLPPDTEASFGYFLSKYLFDRLPFGQIYYIDPTYNAPEEECLYYTKLLQEAPIDLIAMGIGENGHIAFNDPPVADFDDPYWVKVVDLDPVCRQQQVNDGTFPDLQAVPTHAITLTIPALFSAGCIICTVPGKSKSRAVKATLEGPVSIDCPASILRNHPDASLFIDLAAASQLADYTARQKRREDR